MTTIRQNIHHIRTAEIRDQAMLFDDVGILGTGVWESPALHNDDLGQLGAGRVVRDPFHGKVDESGNIQLAGMSLSVER